MEWIKRDRNHPSVILWSFGNELQFQEERCGFPTRDWGVTTYDIMNTLAKRLDPTRPTTVAMYPARAGGIVKHSAEFTMEENIVPPELAQHTEVASFNYCWEDYDKYVRYAPQMIVYQSEATTNELAAPFYGMDRDRMVGLAYWGAIEYWGESIVWPKKGWDYSFFRHSLEPNPQAYLIRSLFLPDEPQVHIAVEGKTDTLWWNDLVVGQTRVSDHWNRTTGERLTVNVYSNAEEVELLLNGKSLGTKQNDQDSKRMHITTWRDVAYAPGRLIAIARTNHKEVARHQIETTGRATRLIIETENADWRADGQSLQFVKVYAVDSKGRHVPTAEGTVTFEVEGAATLLAVDNGDHSSEELFAGKQRRLYEGFALATLRSVRNQPGRVTIRANVPGLKAASKTLQTR